MNLFKNQMFLNRTKYVIKIKGIIKKEYENNMKKERKEEKIEKVRETGKKKRKKNVYRVLVPSLPP